MVRKLALSISIVMGSPQETGQSRPLLYRLIKARGEEGSLKRISCSSWVSLRIVPRHDLQ